jgi:hypothetical protein
MDAHHRGGGRAALLLFAFAIVACAPDPPPSSIAAKNYERKCASVADCVPVYEGHIGCCGGGECPNTAIAQVALATYTADAARAATCAGGQPPCTGVDVTRPGDGCQGGRIACDNGICTLKMLPSDAATDE